MVNCFMIFSKPLIIILELFQGPKRSILAFPKGSYIVVSDLKSFQRQTETDSQDVPASLYQEL